MSRRSPIRDITRSCHRWPGTDPTPRTNQAGGCKANVVADALSRKTHCNCLAVESYDQTLCSEMRRLNLEMIPQGTLNHISIEPTLHDQIIMAQLHDEGVKIIKQKLSQGEEKYKCFRQGHNGILWFESCIVVPKNHEL